MVDAREPSGAHPALALSELKLGQTHASEAEDVRRRHQLARCVRQDYRNGGTQQCAGDKATAGIGRNLEVAPELRESDEPEAVSLSHTAT